MKILFLITLFLILTSCGIDKEPGPITISSSNLGELDITFQSDGVYALDGSAGGANADDEIYDITKDSQDRIIAVGKSNNGSTDDMAVWRLTASGAIDTSFSGDGVFSHNGAAGGNSTDVGYSVVVDSNDNIYVSGTSYNGTDFDMTIWKLTSSGALDSTFSGDGIFTHDSAAGGGIHDQGTAIHIDGSGRLVVAGFSDQTAVNRDMAVWRVSTAGVLDTASFNSPNGFFTHDSAAGGVDDVGNDVLTDSSGNIYVVGNSDAGANLEDMAIWKLTSAGALDTGFNGTGFLTQNGGAGGAGFDSATAFLIDSDGNMLITGFSRNADGNNDMMIWKVTSLGAFDTTFDGDGFLSFDVADVSGGGPDDTGEDIILDSEGRIVVAGTGNQNACVWRYDTDGNLDTLFNQDGFFAHDGAAGGFGIDSVTSLVEGENNRLYLGGFSENTGNDFDATFWRLK